MPFDDAGGRGPGRGPAARNVLGSALRSCSAAPPTGFYRTGCCETGPEDAGNVRGISTGVLFAGIAVTVIIVVILGCVGNRRCRKGRLEKHVEHGS